MILFLILLLSFSCGAQTLKVEKPSPCYEIKEIREEKGSIKIFLSRKKGVLCPQVISFEEIELKNRSEKVEIYVEGKLWKIRSTEELKR